VGPFCLCLEWSRSEVAKDVWDRDTLRMADLARNGTEKSKADCFALRNRDAVPGGSAAFDENVTASLANCFVVPMAHEMLDEALAGYIAWRFQATASFSARTNSTRAGLVEPS
jgi:hypothetical protein